MPPPKNPNYVNNEELYKEIVAYLEKLKTKPGARIPESLGKKILLISNGVAHNYRFIRYGFREDLIYEGVFDICRYIRNYDPEKTNPHAYFTTICFNAFLRRIAKEKKNLYTKFKMQLSSGHEMNMDSNFFGESGDIQHGTAGDFSRMAQFVEEYENSSAFTGIKK